MYLPKELNNQKVLITVKTYPRPTPTHEEIVCTAGILEDGKWIRLYPIPFRGLAFENQFSKYQWVQMNLVKTPKDFRIESYQPKLMYDEQINNLERIGTKNKWAERKRIILKEVFESMDEIINLSKTQIRSLATLKPAEIIKFTWEEEEERQWDKRYTSRLKQMKLFETPQERKIVKKLPYKFYYHLLSKGDSSPRKMMIQDWEIGALYWNCLANSEGDEFSALELVRKKYFDDFAMTKDVYLFLGTIYKFQKLNAPNPFHITGVFSPPKDSQITLGI